MQVTQEQVDAALSQLTEQVHLPVFFQKLAAHGITPNTQTEAAQLVELGAMLSHAEAAGQYKTAAAATQEAENPFLKYAANMISPNVGPAPAELAAAAVQNDDLLKTAALIYGHVLAGGAVSDAQSDKE